MRATLPIGSLVLCLLAGGCVPPASSPMSEFNAFSPEQIKIAGKRAETPAHISTVEFKELGDTKRSVVVAKFIRSTWGETCDPTGIRLDGYVANGSSQWNVVCRDSLLPRDYVVAIPEHAKDNARVLKCRRLDARVNRCSIIGSPEEASIRTASAGS